MELSYLVARNEIFAQFGSSLPAISTFLGYEPIVIYQGLEAQTKAPTDKLWFRLSMQTVIESQANLTGNDLKRRYTSDGLVFAQLFIPKTQSQNYAQGVRVAELVKNAYRGQQTSNCMWFRNVRIQELPPEEAWYRLNIVAEYQYDEIG